MSIYVNELNDNNNNDKIQGKFATFQLNDQEKVLKIDNKSESKINMTESIATKNEPATNEIKEATESDDHLPRVQVELDKLNYANESINNLELELEDCKKEYIRTIQETDEQLSTIEKKLGSCVEKSKPYYDARVDLNDAKEKYFLAKHRFETAQELYVAAKNIQLYAEDNLENFSSLKSNNQRSPNSNSISRHSEYNELEEKETLIKILEIAKNKVNDTELSKQSSDQEQIEAFKVYEEKKKLVEMYEKELKKQIEKSKHYFEIKSSLNKELRFLFTKIEGLKSCLKEAKLAYQQSLNNLESISSEIHIQRQITLNTAETSNLEAKNQNKQHETKLISPSSSTLSSSSSSSMENNNNNEKSLDAATKNDEEEKNLIEDFDLYFTNSTSNQIKNEIAIKPNKNKARRVSEKKKTNKSSSSSGSSKTTQSLISDEDIENIGLDAKLKKYKEELDVKRKTGECVAAIEKKINKINDSLSMTNKKPTGEIESENQLKLAVVSTSTLPNSPNTTPARPQFRLPTISFLNKK